MSYFRLVGVYVKATDKRFDYSSSAMALSGQDYIRSRVCPKRQENTLDETLVNYWALLPCSFTSRGNILKPVHQLAFLGGGKKLGKTWREPIWTQEPTCT